MSPQEPPPSSSPAPAHPPPTHLLALSGPSSSGKTTLARLLHALLPPGTSFILHEDDFYLPDAQIPTTTVPSTGAQVQDWDCAEALDLAAFARALAHIRAHGRPPPDLHPSLQDQQEENNTTAPSIPPSTLAHYRARLRALFTAANLPCPPSPSTPPFTLALIDGFLLYPPLPTPIYTYLHTKLFLPLPRTIALARRRARSGYATCDGGYWQDPPGYVEGVVWPAYVRDHGFLFRDEGDVEEGVPDAERLRRCGVMGMPVEVVVGGGLEGCLEWVWREVVEPVVRGLVEEAAARRRGSEEVGQ